MSATELPQPRSPDRSRTLIVLTEDERVPVRVKNWCTSDPARRIGVIAALAGSAVLVTPPDTPARLLRQRPDELVGEQLEAPRPAWPHAYPSTPS